MFCLFFPNQVAKRSCFLLGSFLLLLPPIFLYWKAWKPLLQTEKPSFAKVIKEMADSIRGGSSLSSSTAKTPKLFGEFYVSLVNALEASGRLEETLLYL